MPEVSFPQFFRASDFGAGSTATNIQITSGQFNQVGSKTVGAQQRINFGVGVIANGVDSRELAKVRFDSVAGTIAGQIRLAVQDANGINTIPVYENNHTNFNTGTTVKLGLALPGAREDSKLLILYKPDSTTTIAFNDADNDVNLPVTVTNLN